MSEFREPVELSNVWDEAVTATFKLVFPFIIIVILLAGEISFSPSVKDAECPLGEWHHPTLPYFKGTALDNELRNKKLCRVLSRQKEGRNE